MPAADESEYPLKACNHEEFDTRVMLHAANAVWHGYKRILIIANGIDIIVLGISFFGDIGADKLCLIWNCKQIAEHFNSYICSRPYDVFRQGKSSSRSPCPDRIR